MQIFAESTKEKNFEDKKYLIKYFIVDVVIFIRNWYLVLL